MGRRQIDTVSAESYLDGILAGMPSLEGAIEIVGTNLLPATFPLAADYIRNFPDLAVRTDGVGDSGNECLLSPTCCYPVFHQFAGKIPTGNLWTSKAFCYRNEGSHGDQVRSPVFKMREYIFISSKNETEEWILAVCNEVPKLMATMGIKVTTEVASDAFFGESVVAKWLQEKLELKKEFRTSEFAVASINSHLNAFCKKCGIERDGQFLYSACLGFGYSRILHAMGSGSGTPNLEEHPESSIPMGTD